MVCPMVSRLQRKGCRPKLFCLPAFSLWLKTGGGGGGGGGGGRGLKVSTSEIFQCEIVLSF